MTCYDILMMVAALVGEDPDDSGSKMLKRRLPALINIVYPELLELDRAYRRYVNGEIVSDKEPHPVNSLGDECPVCTRLAPALAFYVAALVIRDENAALAEMLSRDYINSRDTAAASIPSHSSEIRDRYAGL